jgi:hypothetical protein
VKDGNLVSIMIVAKSPDEARSIFLQQHSVAAQIVLGPFYKKKTQVLEVTRSLHFKNQFRRATYNGWLVNAHPLLEPEDQAYLLFIKRIDDKKMPTPKGTIVVPISDLRFDNE